MGSIGSRLKEERERLGLSQTALADVGGATRKTQFNYETDTRRPDADYLASIAGAGVDVLYVLLGDEPNRVLPPALPPKEQIIIDAYRNGSREQQDFILKAALGFVGTTSTTQSPAVQTEGGAYQSAGINTGLMVAGGAGSKRRKNKN